MARPYRSTPASSRSLREEDEGSYQGKRDITDPKNVSNAALNKYIETLTTMYKDDGATGQDLWVTVKEDLCDWDDQIFPRVDRVTLRKFRDVLWDLGVYTPKDRSSVTGHIINLFNQPYPDWPATVPLPHAVEAANRGQQEEDQDSAKQNSTPRGPTPHKTAPAGEGILPVEEQEPDLTSDFKELHIKSINGQKALRNYRPQSYTEQLLVLRKLYDDKMRYAGDVNDSFDYKFNIFLHTCELAGFPRSGLPVAFRFMLKGVALDYYFMNIIYFKSMGITALYNALSSYFEGRAYRINRYSEWVRTSLETVINANKGKDLRECVDILISKLRILQYGLDENLQTDDFLRIQLLLACESHPVCQRAQLQPASTAAGVMRDLRALTLMHDTKNSSTSHQASVPKASASNFSSPRDPTYKASASEQKGMAQQDRAYGERFYGQRSWW